MSKAVRMTQTVAGHWYDTEAERWVPWPENGQVGVLPDAMADDVLASGRAVPVHEEKRSAPETATPPGDDTETRDVAKAAARPRSPRPASRTTPPQP